MDARDNFKAAPLLSRSQMSQRNQQAQLPCRIYTSANNKSYITIVEMLVGVQAKDITIYRDTNDRHLVHIEWPSRIQPGVLQDLFCCGSQAVGFQGSSTALNLLPLDPNLHAMNNQMEHFFGSERNNELITSSMIIRFDKEIKSSTSDWTAVMTNGKNFFLLRLVIICLLQ